MSDIQLSTREIAPDTTLLAGCVVPQLVADRLAAMDDPPPWYEQGRAVHAQFNAYLLDGAETLLFDTLPPNFQSALLTELDERDVDLDYVVVSHPEAPHGGNAEALLRANPDATLVVPAADALHDLALTRTVESFREVAAGDVLDLGGRELEFVHPVLFDLASTAWAHDSATGALFTVDAYGNTHVEGECGDFVDELADDPEQFTALRWPGFHAHTFPWLAYVDPDRVMADVEAVVERLDPSMVCPAHGAVVREDATAYLRRLRPVLETIVEQGLGQDVRV
ncbi:MAG: MBL fold metallo-hydrolase [Haloarculaceae archaeon]